MAKLSNHLLTLITLIILSFSLSISLSSADMMYTAEEPEENITNEITDEQVDPGQLKSVQPVSNSSVKMQQTQHSVLCCL